MPVISIEIPDELFDRMAEVREQLPELLALSLHQPALPAATYRAIVDFLASNPTAAEVAAFTPPPVIQQRLQLLLERSQAGTLTTPEARELDEFARIEHVMVMLKAGKLTALPSRP
ncbi:hypothetical protein [Candidatus Chloroploca sp. Khr17]|uniref:hypothetical protein n=1 Tax=Candidatus Chloroploca sp. Khr17 TaxID=2496869 RepID=UPI00101B5FB1|nr:hypothetical protein [Candidatus Chloroploca sp. Khr17]NCC35260.1 hypothetical protein [Chloroflexia bacterium]